MRRNGDMQQKNSFPAGDVTRQAHCASWKKVATMTWWSSISKGRRHSNWRQFVL